MGLTLAQLIAAKKKKATVKKSKYGNVRTEIDGINFSSKLEASYYQKLKIELTQGELLYFLRQVPLHLPGGTKYICDFVCFYKSGYVQYIDTKGVETDIFKLKKKQVEALYPIKIDIVKSCDIYKKGNQ